MALEQKRSLNTLGVGCRLGASVVNDECSMSTWGGLQRLS